MMQSKISSINGHIKPPEGSVFTGAGVNGLWFVISYEGREAGAAARTDIYFNQEGREVFRIEGSVDARTSV